MGSHEGAKAESLVAKAAPIITGTAAPVKVLGRAASSQARGELVRTFSSEIKLFLIVSCFITNSPNVCRRANAAKLKRIYQIAKQIQTV